MSKKKAAGSSKNGRDSHSRRLGVKKYEGQYVNAGNIILRQVGGNVLPGHNINKGKDYTLTSLIDGYVKFSETRIRGKFRKKVVSIIKDKPKK